MAETSCICSRQAHGQRGRGCRLAQGAVCSVPSFLVPSRSLHHPPLLLFDFCFLAFPSLSTPRVIFVFPFTPALGITFHVQHPSLSSFHPSEQRAHCNREQLCIDSWFQTTNLHVYLYTDTDRQGPDRNKAGLRQFPG